MLNFDSPSLSDYRAERLAWGWRISFGFADGDTAYHAGFEVSTATGETVLTLAAPDLVMRYVGWLWDKRIGDPKVPAAGLSGGFFAGGKPNGRHLHRCRP